MLPVYTLSDLTPDALAELPKPARLAVIGNPIAHSRSPQMQQAALDAAGIDASYIRVLAGLEDGEFEHTIHHLKALGFIGVNVTVPFKKKAFAMADRADALARLSGAANTLKFTKSGCEAFNTDGPGFAQAIQSLSGFSLNGLRVLILGACGGAGSALAAQCALSGCRQLILANRPRPELGELAAKLTPHLPVDGCRILIVSMADDEAFASAVKSSDLIVNATILGLREGDSLPLRLSWLKAGQIVYDIVPHDTLLRFNAAKLGCMASDGVSMLLWQGACSFAHWFGAMPSVDAMRAALAQAH